MMSMIINLVLLYQGSTKYNIASLDELDSMLDSRNRSQFVQVLYKSIDILNINQLFIISHSIETETADCDIIRLKQYQDYESSVQSGNIIYDYEATNK
jgi:ABC-type oligopeptide transport system ATPase subunit